MSKNLIYFIIFIGLIKAIVAQEQKFSYLNDSLLLKKEILETFLIGKQKSATVFNERVSTYQALYALKNSKTYKKQLKKYFSTNTINSLLFYSKEELHPIIQWNNVYENQSRDSATFIWERQIDDFIHMDDSMISAKKLVKYERKFLWYFAPEVFSVTTKDKIQTYALVYSYPYQNKESYGYDIDLYEKKNGKWEILLRFMQSTPGEIFIKQEALRNR